jgi:hypothetical protein
VLSLIQKYHCEICGSEKRTVNHWLLGEVTENGVLVSVWREDRAQTMGVRHFCGEGHVQVFVSRYLSSPESFALARIPALRPEEKDMTAVQSHLVRKVMEQAGGANDESEEIFDLLAAAEAALKGRVTIGSLNPDHFDA